MLIPATMRGREIFLNLRRVSVIAKVRINGHQVGAEDSGGYLMMQLPYLIDITQYVHWQGTNIIEVEVWGGKLLPFPGNMEDTFVHAHDFPPDAMSNGRLLYPCCVDNWDGRHGLNGDVSLEAYPKVYVSDVYVVTDLHQNRDPLDDEITLHLTLENRDTKTHKIQVHNLAHSLGGDSTKEFETSEVELPPSSTMAMTVPNVAWTNALYWWPDCPQLYELETRLTENGAIVDLCDTRFGFRQFYVRGNHYELNGVRVNLRGDAYEFSWHENYHHGPSTAPEFSTKELMPAYQRRLLHEYQELNNNVLRVHKASGIDALYDACDETGMMVLDEAPFWETWLRTDECAKTNYEAWVRRWIRERRNHPSIIAWDAANECWYGPIGMYSVQAARAMDPTRPVFQDDPWGPHPHSDPAEPYPGDELCHHYTGGYPCTQINTENLYEVYRADPHKPTGEGEAMYADGWPLMNADGTLSGTNSRDGEFGNPNLISQAQWLHSAARMVRAMRYAGLADSRLYADWMYAFDPIEADLKPHWPDVTAFGIQPVILHRPILNLFTTNYPAVKYNDGRDYYRDSFAPVAVFDKEADQHDVIGAKPRIYPPGAVCHRTLILYNDTFHGGEEINVHWSAEASDPGTGVSQLVGQGSVLVPVPCGERREHAVAFALPNKLAGGRWLNLVLTASKSGPELFCETNRLGAVQHVPPPLLVVEPHTFRLDDANPADLAQWHVVRLKNPGGDRGELWTLAGARPPVHFNLTSGNLRGEQEIYFQIETNRLAAGEYHQSVRFTGAGGSTDQLGIYFSAHETSPH